MGKTERLKVGYENFMKNFNDNIFISSKFIIKLTLFFSGMYSSVENQYVSQVKPILPTVCANISNAS